MKRKISLLHCRIASLAEDAIAKELIVSCHRTDSNTYLLVKKNEILATEYPAVAVGVLLLNLLERV